MRAGFHPKVWTGLDVLVARDFQPLRGQRVGAIANPTSVDGRMRHLADHLHGAGGVELIALFSPEHGVRGDAQDMVGIATEPDARTGVVVHSLYGRDVASLTPTADQLAGMDVLIFDVQDVGSRYYTFAATMLYAMVAAADSGIRFLVLDRPNPLGGEVVEGPTIRPGFESFVGAHPVPIRHGMTVGELAELYRAERKLDLDLEVIRCRGWERGMLWSDTGLPWVSPSPNMPTPETALLYPGACLIEGTNLSEGRGTTRPFALWGAPWLDPYALAESVPDDPAILLRPCAFRPMFHKHAGQLCFGVQPHVSEAARVRPIALYTRLLAAARAHAPDRFAWRTDPYEFVDDPIAIDLLYGSSRERLAIEGWSEDRFAELKEAWVADEATFLERRRPALLYESRVGSDRSNLE